MTQATNSSRSLAGVSTVLHPGPSFRDFVTDDHAACVPLQRLHGPAPHVPLRGRSIGGGVGQSSRPERHSGDTTQQSDLA
jgi:hypothetical protein